LNHFKAILDGEQKFDGFRVWRTYRGVPLFMAEVSGELMVYAVEDLGGNPPACKISVMFAGVRRVGCAMRTGRWDGSNDEVLWTGLAQPRCRQHFEEG
jgi:hypothetical protein